MDNELIQDVVIHTTKHITDRDRIPLKNRFDLSSDLWIGRLPIHIADKIFSACRPKGYNWEPTRQFGQHYSFVRENPPDNNDVNWDTDNRLKRCIALSRIVHPTSVSFKYSARIFTDNNNDIKMVVPGSVSGPGSAAFVVDTANDFLIKNDAEKLKILIETVDKEPLKDPIARAMWYHEYACRSYEIDVRWTFIASALEALIHTDKYSSTKQFVKRIVKLSEEVGVCDISESDAENMYDMRSSLAHGQGLGDITDERKQLYKKMEDVLRYAVRKAILDTNFKTFLSDSEKIKREWPV